MNYIKNEADHISVGRGRSARFTFPIKETIGTSPVCYLGVKRNPDDDQPILVLEAEPNLTARTVTFTFRPSHTAGLEEGSYFYDVALAHNGGEYADVIRGALLDIEWTGSRKGDTATGEGSGGGSGEATLGEKTINSNGTYAAETDGYDGYSSVTVEVPTEGSDMQIAQITIGTAWTGSGPYRQTVTIPGASVSAESVIDLQPDAAAIAQLMADGVQGLYIENNAGTLTAVAVGAPTTTALTMQCTVTGVEATSSWTSGTWEYITTCILQARVGLIDLQRDLGWAVGDKRTITIGQFTDCVGRVFPSQSMDLVISAFDDYNGSGSVMQFDFAHTLSLTTPMNATDTNAGGYGSSLMHTTTIPALVAALPSQLANLMLTVPVLVSAGGGSSSIVTVTGKKLALRSEAEVFGSTTYSASGEGSQIGWYQTAANRLKKRGADGSINIPWLLRSPEPGSSQFWCLAGGYTTAAPGRVSGSGTYGLAPFGLL